jgi:hypothetical protein
MHSREAANTNFIVFGLKRQGIEPMIYSIQGEHANHYVNHRYGSDCLGRYKTTIR